MKLNEMKTQLLCVLSGNKEEKTTFVRSGGQVIESTGELKMLGFVFGRTPDATEHIKYPVKKVNLRMWLLRNLVKAGWDCRSVLKVYNTCIRPIIEYLSPIYTLCLP
jgi:hypothetical protein